MKKSMLFIPLLGLLFGCQPPLTRDQQLAIYRSRCMDYGYKWGTPEFADCMMKQEARQEKLSVQMRKAQALEQSNWIAEQEVRAREKKLELDQKKYRKNYKNSKH